ncbi:MAG: hypothetical protein ABF379_04820 [Akkermansiaceae bacterium]|jgi:hypothetical protein
MKSQTSILGLLLIAFGIGVGIFVIDEEDTLSLHESSRIGSGLVSGLAILSGALLQISREHRK